MILKFSQIFFVFVIILIDVVFVECQQKNFGTRRGYSFSGPWGTGFSNKPGNQGGYYYPNKPSYPGCCQGNNQGSYGPNWWPNNWPNSNNWPSNNWQNSYPGYFSGYNQKPWGGSGWGFDLIKRAQELLQVPTAKANKKE